jgi:demethylmenaquinone methyltransferase/2-methoxy-6-polyprenyl-1,4-benzoquinol methylase
MYSKDSPQTIQSMFDSIAEGYDRTNFVLSLSLHRRWNRSLVNAVKARAPGPFLVDLCAGTGDIAFDYLNNITTAGHAVLIDFSPKMLDLAKKKALTPSLSRHQIEFIESDVQQLPLRDNLADCATIAYGIRNVKEPIRCIEETLRVLKPGGCLGILELTRPHSRLLSWGHRIYMKMLSPFIGKMIADNPDAYHYLTNSIQAFASPDELAAMMRSVGFTDVQSTPLFGGIATIILGQKPKEPTP